MPRTIIPEIQSDDFRFGVVRSTFNDTITARLLVGALDALKRAGVKDEDTDVVEVPGSFEIPAAAQRLARSGRYHSIICLGAVIRGETPHFEYICSEVSRGIGYVSLESSIPVIFGILTVDTLDQAFARAVVGGRNKGSEAAIAALKMANLWKMLDERRPFVDERGLRARQGP